MRRRRSRQVEIFNFSFLDILACTIGLLIFIMVMVFILQSGSPVANTRAIVEKSQDRAREIRSQAERDDQIAGELETQLGQIRTSVDPQVTAQRDAAQVIRDAARTLYDEKTKQLAQAQTTLQTELRTEQQTEKQNIANAEARVEAARAHLDAALHKLAKAKADAREAATVRFLPHAQSRNGNDAASYQILHVDCRAKEVVLLEVSGDGTAKELGRSPNDALGGGSEFARIIEKHQRHPKPLVLLWVRPDGVHSFEQAMEALPAGIDHGYEPADADWKFIGGAVP